jgi:lysophospholipase L1-like esterase
MNTNPSAFRVLCYGDSYTWGYVPATDHDRFPVDIRWTGILQKELGGGYEIIEEGLNSRTLNSEDTRKGKEGRNGKEYLIPCLDTHDPIDVVILLLGTNELKDSFSASIDEIGVIIVKDYIEVILNRESQFRNTTPKVILVSPPILDLSRKYAQERYSKSSLKNKKLGVLYSEIAGQYNCDFVDSAKFTKVGEDGVHIDKESHKSLGIVLATRIKKNNKLAENKSI